MRMLPMVLYQGLYRLCFYQRNRKYQQVKSCCRRFLETILEIGYDKGSFIILQKQKFKAAKKCDSSGHLFLFVICDWMIDHSGRRKG